MTSIDVDKIRSNNPSNQVWLNLASHYYVLPHFINLDNHVFLTIAPIYKLIRPFLSSAVKGQVSRFYEARISNILLWHDCRKELPLPSESVDHVLCSHAIHLVYPDEADAILAELRRVMKPGASFHLIAPDLRWYIQRYLDDEDQSTAADRFLLDTEIFNSRRRRFRYRLLEFLGFEPPRARWFYDEVSLERKLARAGFQRCEPSCGSPSSQFRAGDPAALNILFRRGR